MLTSMYTLKSDCQGFTLISLLTPTVDTTYCDGVLIACLKTSQFMLCNTGSSDVKKSSIWGLRIVGGNVDEVEISTVSTTQCPAHSDIHSSTGIPRQANTGGDGDRGRTWRKEWLVLISVIRLDRSHTQVLHFLSVTKMLRFVRYPSILLKHSDCMVTANWYMFWHCTCVAANPHHNTWQFTAVSKCYICVMNYPDTLT